jgi:hypothetical protein
VSCYVAREKTRHACFDEEVYSRGKVYTTSRRIARSFSHDASRGLSERAAATAETETHRDDDSTRVVRTSERRISLIGSRPFLSLNILLFPKSPSLTMADANRRRYNIKVRRLPVDRGLDESTQFSLLARLAAWCAARLILSSHPTLSVRLSFFSAIPQSHSDEPQ